MGEVWAALHLALGREVAVKLIFEGSPELASRLKREALACGRLEHPNIVRVYDFGETENGEPFLVMEQLTGETLADRLARQQRLPVLDAVTIALEVARALRAAHEAGIVHRDLKPANVFLTDGPEGVSVKVLDFGVSKILTSFDMSVTTAGSLVGSPAYMSPEQARALPEIDARADLWSMGVLLFEMLTGTRPFSAPTVVGVVTEILAGTIPTLSAAIPDIDPRLDGAVRRCLTREVEQRMPSAAALCEVLAPLTMGGDPPYPPAQPVRAALQTKRPAVVEDLPTFIDLPRKAEPAEEEKTIARLPSVATDDGDDDRETAVMTGRDVLAFRMANRTLATQRLPTPVVAPPAPVVAPPAPTFTPSVLQMPVDEAGSTLLLPPQGLPPAPPAPPPIAAPVASWDTADTLRRMPAPPNGETDTSRDTLAPGWDRRHNAQTLWMMAIAGLVLSLVAFAGLSLLR
jgi:serine/threonine-protein kinase